MRGGTELDSIIAIAIFLTFISWAFVYYNTIYQTETDVLSGAASDANNKILDFLQVDVSEVPIKVEVVNNTNNALMFINFSWPPGTENSSKLFESGTSLPCQIIGNSLFWEADLVNSSPNYFTMRFSTQNSTSLNCNSAFALGNETQIAPFSEETRKMISQEKIYNMTNASYDDFKSDLLIGRDFQVELNMSGSVTTYGLGPPPASDVVAHKTFNVIEETNQEVEINVLVF